jgi:hypothetical protein
MPTRYVKTPAGHAEIQAKAMALSRPVRNLLLLINDSQPDDYWLQQIRGVSESDLDMLRSAQLIEARGGTSGRVSSSGNSAAAVMDAFAVAAAAADAEAVALQAAHAANGMDSQSPSSGLDSGLPGDDASAALWNKLNRAVREASYNTLYDVLTSQGKAALGLMRGYRFALEVERCNGLPELQAFTLEFLEQLRDDHGMATVRRFYDALRRS